jgi:hypothetical protein
MELIQVGLAIDHLGPDVFGSKGAGMCAEELQARVQASP